MTITINTMKTKRCYQSSLEFSLPCPRLRTWGSLSLLKKKKRLTTLTEVLKTRTKMKTLCLMQSELKGSRKGNYFLISNSILFKAAPTLLLRCSQTPTVLPGLCSGETALCHSESLAFGPSWEQLILEDERDCVQIEENDFRVFASMFLLTRYKRILQRNYPIHERVRT